ncbi:hypothetical protein EON62_02780, partial [archaeon]
RLRLWRLLTVMRRMTTSHLSTAATTAATRTLMRAVTRPAVMMNLMRMMTWRTDPRRRERVAASVRTSRCCRVRRVQHTARASLIALCLRCVRACVRACVVECTRLCVACAVVCCAAKEPVEPLVPAGVPLVKEFSENHTDTAVSFTVRTTPAVAKLFAPCATGSPDSITPAVRKVFKLETSIATGNMHLFDPAGNIARYESPDVIIDTFFEQRMGWYAKRKEYLLAKLTQEVERLSNRARFVKAVIAGDLVVANRKKHDILAELHDAGYKGFEPTESDADAEDVAAAIVEAENAGVGAAGAGIPVAILTKRYHYLLSMPLWHLTAEKVAALMAELADKEAQFRKLKAASLAQLWHSDLNDLERALTEFEADVAAEASASASMRRKAGKVRAAASAARSSKVSGAGKKGKKKAAAWEADSDEEEDADFASDSDASQEDDMEVAYVAKSKRSAAGTSTSASVKAASKMTGTAAVPPPTVSVFAAPPVVKVDAGAAPTACVPPSVPQAAAPKKKTAAPKAASTKTIVSAPVTTAAPAPAAPVAPSLSSFANLDLGIDLDLDSLPDVGAFSFGASLTSRIAARVGDGSGPSTASATSIAPPKSARPTAAAAGRMTLAKAVVAAASVATTHAPEA